MSTGPKKFFSTSRMAMLVAILLIACISAFVVIFKWYPPQVVANPNATPAPITVKNAPGQPQATAGLPGSQGEPFSMNISLSQGQAVPQTAVPLPQATGQPLPPSDIDQILARLPTLPANPADQTTFNRPAESLPPPLPGTTVQEPFPPLQINPTPLAAPSGPLQVLRYTPIGEIPVAPFISVTFNQPMVPLGTLADLAAKDVPVQVQPALPGTWRWLGTKTLTFEYDSTLIDRLPKATEYTVSVPAGTKSLSGGVLAQAVTWKFTTPPPTVTSTYPSGDPQPLSPIFFAAFDQRIDPASVLASIHVTAAGQPVSLVLASTDEIKKDAQVSEMVKNTSDGRWLAFRATAPFPPATAISVSIGPGTPSAEGPLLSTKAQTFGFNTYTALRIEEYTCNSYNNTCPPLSPFTIRFNNALDMSAFSQDLLSVEPAIPGVSANVYGDTIQIDGQTKGRTTYTVTVSGKIKDIFGQQLGADAHLVFKVGAAEPLLVGPDQNFITLDPSATKPVFSVYAINYSKLAVKIYAVQPADWSAFKQYMRDWRNTNANVSMPGKLVSDKNLDLNLPADTLSQVDIDLSPFMSGSSGQFVVIVAPPKPLIELPNDTQIRLSRTFLTWVQITKIGLDAFTDHSSMVTWTTDLRNGSPLAGVSIQSDKGGTPVVTGADGTAKLDIPNGATYLLASQGTDQALLPRSPTAWSDEPWTSSPPRDELRWYVYDDRGMYRPGEEVHVKGWLRRIGNLQDGDVSLVGSGVSSVSYTITDPQGSAIGNGSAQVNSLGGFDLSYSIPANTNLGSVQMLFTAQGSLSGLAGGQFMHLFQVQQFRTPEFEVTARNETSTPYYAGDQAVVAVDAKYYAGGGLPNADVTWQVTTSPTNYSPPNWPDYTFGEWTPWWVNTEFNAFPPINPGKVETFTGKTDASGTHYLRLNFNPQGDPSVEPRPQSVVAQATVMDVNRQAWTSSTSLLVHPASLYIGLHSDRYFVELNAPLKIDYIVTDLDGKPAPGVPVVITAARLDWKYVVGPAGGNANWVQQAVETQTCSQTSRSDPDSCIFKTPVGGTYQITATVSDSLGRMNQSRFTRWVSGGKLPPSRKVEQEQVTLIPDKQTYQAGDTAHILVQSPFSPAEGLLTVSRSGTLFTKRFQLVGGTASINIPILETYIPNLGIQVDLVGSAPRVGDDGITPLPNLPARPAYASGSINLSIPPLQRTLAVQVTPDQAKLAPGTDTNLTVLVKDASGQPVPDAEVSVVVVDEAILALTDYKLTDPLSIFYTDRPSYFNGVYSRANLVLADPLALAQQASANQGQRSLAGAALPAAPAATAAPAMELANTANKTADHTTAPAIQIRSDFNPLALFSPSVRTGLDGSARVPFKLPDNLTRYRVMVVAVDSPGSKFGTGEASITARLPLMVRPSAPRFLNFGDHFELPVVLQNQTDQAMQVSVAARASNLKLDNAGLSINVPANDRVEVRFPASTDMAGTARFQVAAVSGDYSDAASIELPVYTPATSEAFATYGVIDNGSSAQAVQYPTGVYPQYGGLEITTSSTALQALTDAVLYLVNYPYEYSEPLASRILAIASLRDVLSAFKADGLPSPDQLQATVDADIKSLSGLQNADGGFPTWERGYTSDPFASIHVALALQMAGEKGFSVPADMRQNALNYLKQIENYYPVWYSQDTRRTLSAYALYVRNRMGDRDAPKALALLKQAGLDGLSLDAIGWLWPVIDDQAQLAAIRTYVGNRVVETAGAANFTTSYTDQSYLLLSSDRRTDAILLDALMSDNPKSDLIPKLVTGLLAHRDKGRWDNTQENVFVLLALDKYFNIYEAQTPNFVAQIWLGDTYAGSSNFQGRTTDQHQTLIPMSYVLSATASGTQDLILNKDGSGRLYYRLGLSYAPTDLHLPALDMGFTVQRSYEGVDDPSDVTKDANGQWLIKAGARVRVRISMVADNRRYHVALVDPLPAGLEIVNPALAVSGEVPQDPNTPNLPYGWWWWRGTWYEHQNLRDDRAEAFTSLLWDGVYEYSYIARATTPGTFIVPPSKAEEMYSPEVFGRSASDIVIVK